MRFYAFVFVPKISRFSRRLFTRKSPRAKKKAALSRCFQSSRRSRSTRLPTLFGADRASTLKHVCAPQQASLALIFLRLNWLFCLAGMYSYRLLNVNAITHNETNVISCWPYEKRVLFGLWLTKHFWPTIELCCSDPTLAL